MHDSESRLVAILYRVKDLHLLLPAGFYRRFLCVCLRLIFTLYNADYAVGVFFTPTFLEKIPIYKRILFKG
jgi:hypothetical protein